MLSRLQNYFRSWRKEKPELSQSRKSFIVQKEKIKPFEVSKGTYFPIERTVKDWGYWSSGLLKHHIGMYRGSITAENDVLEFLERRKKLLGFQDVAGIDVIKKDIKNLAQKERQKRAAEAREAIEDRPMRKKSGLPPVKRTSLGGITLSGQPGSMLRFEEYERYKKAQAAEKETEPITLSPEAQKKEASMIREYVQEKTAEE
jgi:hypothetical protein